jgi:hypothetical protein
VIEHSLQIAYVSNRGSSSVVFLRVDLSFDFLMVVKQYEEACFLMVVKQYEEAC